MRLVIWSLMIILLVSFVSAEIKVSCETHSECYLINKESSCIEGYCFSHDSGFLTIEDFQPKNSEFNWDVINIEPKTVRCEDCLFAPAKENWLTRFLDWLFLVK